MESREHFDIVLGLTGLKAAGKDELGRYLADRGFVMKRCSDAIREEARRRGLEDPTVEQLQDIGDEGRQRFGEGSWAVELLKMFRQEGVRKAIINGIRNPGEIRALQRHLGDRFVLLGVVAPIGTRAQRFLKRGQAGDPSEMASFLQVDDRDRGIGQPPDGQQVDRCLALVEWENLYNNDSSLEAFHDWIERLLDRIGR
ncbi:hypothetical protein AMJ57_02030 [Parcubacteria bacterium SG8_24]|nr:MAG: hypothetical protein AMJ57_02030 [Parcubacteria bacterium SG8_24]